MSVRSVNLLIKVKCCDPHIFAEGGSGRHGEDDDQEPVGPPRQQPATRGGTLRTRVFWRSSRVAMDPSPGQVREISGNDPCLNGNWTSVLHWTLAGIEPKPCLFHCNLR